jgi:hypothetical protein
MVFEASNVSGSTEDRQTELAIPVDHAPEMPTSHWASSRVYRQRGSPGAVRLFDAHDFDAVIHRALFDIADTI